MPAGSGRKVIAEQAGGAFAGALPAAVAENDTRTTAMPIATEIAARIVRPSSAAEFSLYFRDSAWK